MKISYRVVFITFIFFYYIEKINTISINNLDKRSLKCEKLNIVKNVQ